jgi:hypothetical protein
MVGIGEASVQGKLSAYCPDLQRLLVVVPDQSRSSNAEIACAPRCFLD